MDIITVDIETYYDREFSLKKLTTEEYIRSPQFEIIGVAIKVNNGQTEWASGTKDQLKSWLGTFDWANSMAVAHNTTFDGAILNWLLGINPRYWADTLCMARALHGVEVGGSLKVLAERYNIGEKGTEVLNALGKYRADFSDEELATYGDYCINDVELTYKLFNIMGKKIPKQEFKIIDLTLRMFIDAVLELDVELLHQHRDDIKITKDKLLADCGADKENLMSNPKFAELLLNLGVQPPKKVSPATGKDTWAFSKADDEFKQLASHPDVRVQTLVAARLGTKSTLEETRTERFIGIAGRGRLPVPIKYYAAHTGRFGGEDKINLQNLPSRGENANKLKKSITAPFGYSLIDADSAQIEARVLAWLAGQDDLVEAFAKGEDVYKKMASAIYNKPEDEIDKTERFVGKTTILGAGYGMGAIKFQAQLKNFGVEVSIEESRRIIDIYRNTNSEIGRLWAQAQRFLANISRGDSAVLGRDGVLEVIPSERAIKLPSGLLMRYEGLSFVQGEKGPEFSYKSRYGRNRIYGGKVIENVCQAIARCIIAEQMLLIAKKYRVVLTVHDAVMCVVKDEEVQEATKYIEECMRWTPDWATGLPVNCESGSGKSYGDC
jgi:DNA polymerase